jgi:RNA polymerase sigma-70 factor (ECF subfamily)
LINKKPEQLDTTDFKSLFDRYFDPVRSYVYYRCGNEEIATDVAQEVFVKVWEKQFDLKEGRIKWLLFRMAKETFINVYRKEKVRDLYLESLRFSYPDSQEADEDLVYGELKERYESALARLPEKHREVFLMSRNDELKYSEIAIRLGIGVKAVEKRMSAAIAFLRKELDY